MEEKKMLFSKEQLRKLIVPLIVEQLLVMLVGNAIGVYGLHLAAAGDAKYTMLVGTISMFATRITLTYVFGMVLPMYVLETYFAMFCDWIVRIICFVKRCRSEKWMAYRAI